LHVSVVGFGRCVHAEMRRQRAGDRDAAEGPCPFIEDTLTITTTKEAIPQLCPIGAFGGGGRRTIGADNGASSFRGCESTRSGWSNQGGAKADRTGSRGPSDPIADEPEAYVNVLMVRELLSHHDSGPLHNGKGSAKGRGLPPRHPMEYGKFHGDLSPCYTRAVISCTGGYRDHETRR
jgi:hypothetical protein